MPPASPETTGAPLPPPSGQPRIVANVEDPAPRSRVHGVDIARGIALLGMVAVHVEIGSNEPPSRLGGMLLHAPSGRSAVLFFLLSGVALSIVASRNGSSTTTAPLVRRGVALLAVGLLVIEVVWPTSILHQYGVMFLAAPWLLRRGARTLLVAAALCFTLGAFLGRAGGWLLDPWLASRHGVHGWFLTTLMHIAVGDFPLVVWAGFFMVGIWLGRQRLDSRKFAAALLGGGLVVTAGLTVATDRFNASRFIEGSSYETVRNDDTTPEPAIEPAIAPIVRPFVRLVSAEVDAVDDEALTRLPFREVYGVWWFTSLQPHSDTTAWALQSLAIALALLGACLLLPISAIRFLWPLANLGSITLTGYLVHLVFVLDVWQMLGNNDLDAGIWQQTFTLLGIGVALVTGAWLIRLWWRRGPFEWLLAQFADPRR